MICLYFTSVFKFCPLTQNLRFRICQTIFKIKLKEKVSRGQYDIDVDENGNETEFEEGVLENIESPPIRVFTDYHGNQELWLNFPDQMGWNSVGNDVHEFIKQCLQVKSKDRPSAAKLISVSEYLNGSDSSEIKKIEIKGGENIETQYKALYDTYRSGKVDQMTQSVNVITKEEESKFLEIQKVVFGGKSGRELQDDSEGNASKRVRLNEPVASAQEIHVSQKITDISLDEDRFPDRPADIPDSVTVGF